MDKIKVPEEVIIVEGKSDTQRLVEIFGSEIKTIETNGSAIDNAILNRIQQAEKTHGVIIFTDPDYPGERIRRIIRSHVPTAKEAFLSQTEANSHKAKNSLGIEHASQVAIRTALEKVAHLKPQKDLEIIPMSELIDMGLSGGSQAKELRQKLADEYNLGHVNAKQLQKQLAKYHISRTQILQFLEREVNN